MGIVQHISGSKTKKRILVLVLISVMLPLSLVVLMDPGIRPGILPSGPLYAAVEIGIILLFPAIPLVYGWRTGDVHGAVITGTVPFVLVTIYGALFNPPDILIPGRLYQVLAFLLPLTLLGGLAGYLAALRKYPWFVIALCCAAGWVLIFLSGIT